MSDDAPPWTWSQTRQRLRADRARVRQYCAPEADGIGVYLHPAFVCVLLHRLSHHCHRRGHRWLARLWWHLNTMASGADISAPADLGAGLLIPNPMGVAIAGRAGRNLTVMAGSGLGGELGRREDVGAGPGLPWLGDDVWIEARSGVMGPVRVGDRARIRTGLPVASDVPDDTDVRWPPPTITERAAAPAGESSVSRRAAPKANSPAARSAEGISVSRRAAPKANSPVARSAEGIAVSRRAAPKANSPAARSAEGIPVSRRAAPKANSPVARSAEGNLVSGPRLVCVCRREHGWSPVWRAVHADVTRFLNKSPENQAVGDTLRSRTGALLTPQLLCLLFYRIAHRLQVAGWPRLAGAVVRANALVHRVHISADSCIGPGCLLPHPAGLVFVGHAGAQLTLYSMAVCCPSGPVPLAPADRGPHLGERVSVGVHAVLMGPLQVGDDTLIGPCLKVGQSLPANVMVLARGWRARMHARAHADAQPLREADR
ncbi:hypothetical protein O4H66_22050 [Comamonadaceae bacterium G21597-S1]|nr:hypothetical protein [Comamonadaceae bacterium G21597-S1]